MRKWSLILALVLIAGSTGCAPAREFGKGFGKALTREGFEIGKEFLAKNAGELIGKLAGKLEIKLDGLEEKIKGLPAPAEPAGGADGTVWGGLGALVAYVVGSLGKGALRKYRLKKDS